MNYSEIIQKQHTRIVPQLKGSDLPLFENIQDSIKSAAWLVKLAVLIFIMTLLQACYVMKGALTVDLFYPLIFQQLIPVFATAGLIFVARIYLYHLQRSLLAIDLDIEVKERWTSPEKAEV
ncbi:hypothetical protein P3T73_08210 [Kiritimatiellota bacterium B12222]|nr:hypothetical protein P3T73_08210 [Kiritimatiellota bacterium B12222]